MQDGKPLWALIGFIALTGCGGGGGNSSSISQPVSVPIISPTFPTGNAPPGVNPVAGGTSGTGASQTTTGGTTAGQADAVASIDLAPANATVETNRRLTFSALGRDATGSPVVVPSANWKWTSSDPAVAVLTSSGDHAEVSGVKAGTVVITVLEGKSGVSAQTTLTVTAPNAGGASAPGGSGLGSGTGGGAGATAAGTQVYANDFANGAGNEWSKTTVDTTPGTASHPATKFLGQFAAGTVSLNLGSLPAHNSVTVEFDLFMIRTWDGNAPAKAGPDVWDLSVENGPALLHTTFANITPVENAGFVDANFQAFPDSYPGGVHPYQTGATEVSALGFLHNTDQGDLPSDAAYHLKYTFPHSAATVKFNFTSAQTQALEDESWGLKNVQVTTNP